MTTGTHSENYSYVFAWGLFVSLIILLTIYMYKLCKGYVKLTNS